MLVQINPKLKMIKNTNQIYTFSPESESPPSLSPVWTRNLVPLTAEPGPVLSRTNKPRPVQSFFCLDSWMILASDWSRSTSELSSVLSWVLREHKPGPLCWNRSVDQNQLLVLFKHKTKGSIEPLPEPRAEPGPAGPSEDSSGSRFDPECRTLQTQILN